MAIYFSLHHHPAQQKDGGVVPKDAMGLLGGKSLKDFIQLELQESVFLKLER